MKNINEMEYEQNLNMSNCFHTIDEGLADFLKDNESKIYAQYAGWNFWGYVWYESNNFTCQIWVYGSPQEEITAKTLEEIMDMVSEKYGQD